MTSPHFLPWVGSSYLGTDDSRPRLLVLGESHYGESDSDYPEFTRDVVRKFGLVQRDRYFTTTAKLVLGVPKSVYLTDEFRQTFWNSVAFYNYVPALVGPTSRIRPSEDQWKLGAEILPGVLNDLHPHMILVLGKTLWYRIVGLQAIEGHPTLRRLPTRNGAAVATMTNHPSSFRFSLEHWQPAIQQMASFAGFPDLKAFFGRFS